MGSYALSTAKDNKVDLSDVDNILNSVITTPESQYNASGSTGLYAGHNMVANIRTEGLDGFAVNDILNTVLSYSESKDNNFLGITNSLTDKMSESMGDAMSTISDRLDETTNIANTTDLSQFKELVDKFGKYGIGIVAVVLVAAFLWRRKK